MSVHSFPRVPKIMMWYYPDSRVDLFPIMVVRETPPDPHQSQRRNYPKDRKVAEVYCAVPLPIECNLLKGGYFSFSQNLHQL